MSLEICVLSDVRLATLAEWQRAVEAEGFALRLSTEGSFDGLSGHLPAALGDKHTGFECDHWDAAEFIAEYTNIDFGRRWKHLLAFRWGGDTNASLAAYMAATAYARATGGIVFDAEIGELLPPEKAAQIVREMEKNMPRIKAKLRRSMKRPETKL